MSAFPRQFVDQRIPLFSNLGRRFRLSQTIGNSLSDGSIDVKVASGDVSIVDGSGGISVKHVAGSVTVDDGSGSIKVSDVEHDLIIVDDGSGSVSHNDIRGTVDEET